MNKYTVKFDSNSNKCSTNNSNEEQLIKIHKIIARRGITSNRKAEELIKQGRVKIEGRVAQIGELVRDDIEIIIDSKKYVKDEVLEHFTFIMNKRIGDECSRKTFKNINKSIFSRFDSKQKYFNSLKCVGRLDVLTSGLIIITTNSELIQKIIHPSSNILKTYIVGINRKLDEKHKIQLLSKGVYIEESISKPRQINTIEYSKLNSIIKEQIRVQYTAQKLFWYEIQVSEGKKHIIRKFFEHFRYRVEVLHRSQIGRLELLDFKNLKQGSFTQIKEEELLKLIFN
ncbi:MAG: hypothetical protein LAT82_05940 [Nanoarchaeota archaeon]|nr:hypothetical protein [Nanoarchaeota archaeon]